VDIRRVNAEVTQVIVARRTSAARRSRSVVDAAAMCVHCTEHIARFQDDSEALPRLGRCNCVQAEMDRTRVVDGPASARGGAIRLAGQQHLCHGRSAGNASVKQGRRPQRSLRSRTRRRSCLEKHFAQRSHGVATHRHLSTKTCGIGQSVIMTASGAISSIFYSTGCPWNLVTSEHVPPMAKLQNPTIALVSTLNVGLRCNKFIPPVYC
jgi:hypothetical protein